MPWELFSLYLKLPVFALVAARLGGLLMFQPILGSLSIPWRVRALLVLGLAALLTPLVPWPAQVPDHPAGIMIAMASEVLLGGLIGLLTAACFLGLEIGGQLVAQEAGLAFGQIADPNSDQEQTVVSLFYVQLAAAVYLVIGGHRVLIAACLDTFSTIPLLGDTRVTALGTEALCQALSLSGHVAIRVAAPALLTLFLVNLALGFVSRTMPQLNIIAVGFSVKTLIAFLLMAVALPTAGDTFLTALEHASLWLNELLGT